MAKIKYIGGSLACAVLAGWIFWKSASVSTPEDPLNKSSDAKMTTGQLNAPASGPTSQVREAQRLLHPNADTPQRQKASAAINNVTAPDRPTWEIVRDYARDPKNLTKADEALAALSFCFNTKRNADKARAMQSQGLSSAPEFPAMKRIGEQHAEFCNRILDSEFAMRESLVKDRAVAGEVDAMVSYLSVSPLGQWPRPDQFGDPKVQAWKTAGVGFLEQAVQLKYPGALLQLAGLYEPGTKVAKDEPILFGDMRDPLKAYTYAYAWSQVVGATASENSKKSISDVLQSFEPGLSREQMALAQNNAKAIYSNFKE